MARAKFEAWQRDIEALKKEQDKNRKKGTKPAAGSGQPVVVGGGPKVEIVANAAAAVQVPDLGFFTGVVLNAKVFDAFTSNSGSRC